MKQHDVCILNTVSSEGKAAAGFQSIRNMLSNEPRRTRYNGCINNPNNGVIFFPNEILPSVLNLNHAALNYT